MAPSEVPALGTPPESALETSRKRGRVLVALLESSANTKSSASRLITDTFAAAIAVSTSSKMSLPPSSSVTSPLVGYTCTSAVVASSTKTDPSSSPTPLSFGSSLSRGAVVTGRARSPTSSSSSTPRTVTDRLIPAGVKVTVGFMTVQAPMVALRPTRGRHGASISRFASSAGPGS